MGKRIRANLLNVGWMASDHERETQLQVKGSTDWEQKAASKRPHGRLIDKDEVARAVNFLVSADSGKMTNAIVEFDPPAWGAVPDFMS